MAHVGQGSWASFRRAVANLAGATEEPKKIAPRLRVMFSDLGIAEFFIDGSERWRVFEPLLVTSTHAPNEALLTGARTPLLLKRLRDASKQLGCQYVEVVPQGEPRFSNVKVIGSKAPAVAAACGIRFVADVGSALIAQLPKMFDVLSSSRREAIPYGWTTSAFDFGSNRWRSGIAERTAIEAISPYEERRYYLRDSSPLPLLVPKRISLYAAAYLQGARIAGYDHAKRALWCSALAPLPEPYARAACLVGTRASVVADRRVIYENVPPQLASIMLAGLQQPRPEYAVCQRRDRGRRSDRGRGHQR
jgi:hypothetical protein